MDYAVCEISGRQYLIKPKQLVKVDLLGDRKELEVDKVMLISLGGKLEIGSPYLKQSLKFEVVENRKLDKIRVSKYQPKANSRRVKGSRSEVSVIRLVEAETQAAKKVAKSKVNPDSLGVDSKTDKG